ncbi:hypothetical protein ACLETW_02415 [Citrobacter portucalensis]|uniref:hypothetical protein n=1 Tax=Citrobacter portucalensis TaxID=1639133 RepID=UPI003975B593
MARTKGAIAKGVDNKAVRAFLLNYCSLKELPSIVESCVCGALGQEKESRGFSGERIIAILKKLDYVDTTTVYQQMRAYNICQGVRQAPSRRNSERMTRVLRCASEAIYHHVGLWRINEPTHNKIFNLTDDERENVRRWVKAKDWGNVSGLLYACEMITVCHKPPVFNYAGDNLVGIASAAPITLGPSMRLTYPTNVRESIKDHQPESIFTVKGSRNLQPLIDEIGACYTASRKAA